MINEKITYTDYDGNERTETFYFNLSKAEIAELEMGTDGGMEKMLKKIIDAKDNKRIVEVFKKLIVMSYGEKSDDGRRFIKTPEIQEAFTQTEAYSELFMKLATDTDAATKFVNGIIPKDMADAANKSGNIIAIADKKK